MEVSAFRSLSVFLALSDVLRICELQVSFGSNVRPSILGFFTVGMTTLSMLSVSCVLYSAGSGVKRVLVVLSGLRWSWFCCVHEAISCKYGCSFACAICLFVSVDVIVICIDSDVDVGWRRWNVRGVYVEESW